MKFTVRKSARSLPFAFVLILCVFIVGTQVGYAKRYSVDPGSASLELTGSSATCYVVPEEDTTAAKPKLHLLPDHLSLMESALWGEHGIMRSTGIAPLTPSARKSELGVRRTMLTAHQIGGFITVGMFIPTLIYGQRNINMWNDAEAGRAPFDRSIDRTHRNWAGITWATYMATASLSIFSPPPLIRRDEGSTTTIHKTLAWVHFAGMIALPILGGMGSTARNLSQATGYRTAHQIVAYTTAAALTASMIVMTF